MAQWTHILGTIRYNYWAQNCWCSETKGAPKCYDPKEKIKILEKLYKSEVPSGSDEPIEINVCNSNMGPVVTITGDLRDFYTCDVQKILSWLTNINKEIEELNTSKEFVDTLEIRDSIILCCVEYDQDRYIRYNDDTEKWEISPGI
jgi:hypothetical protein